MARRKKAIALVVVIGSLGTAVGTGVAEGGAGLFGVRLQSGTVVTTAEVSDDTDRSREVAWAKLDACVSVASR